MRTTPVFLILLLVSACGGSGAAPDSGPDSGHPDGSSMPSDAAARDAPGRADAGAEDAGVDAAVDAGPAVRPPYEPPEPAGLAFVGDYVDRELRAFDLSAMQELDASPASLPDQASEVLAIAKHEVVGVTYEGGDELLVLDATTLEPAEGAPYSTAPNAELLAHDDAIDRLYVFCLDDDRGPASLVTVYDTSVEPWQEVEGSPFPIDLTAYGMELDPHRGHLWIRTLREVHGFRVTASGLEPLDDEPLHSVDYRLGGLAIDPERDRLYFASTGLTGPMFLYGYDLETLERVEGSPLELPRGGPGETAVDAETGDVFLVDMIERKFERFAAGPPLASQDACGGGGCSAYRTETGAGVSPMLRRFVHLRFNDAGPGDGAGFLSVWDIGTPGEEEELRDADDQRLRTGVYPIYLSLM